MKTVNYGIYELKEIEKEWKKYKCPAEYNHISLEQLFTNDYSLYMSTRQDGKTTNALLIGLVLFKLYDILPCVIRNDTNQITLSNINALYDVVIDNGYIARLFDNEFNTVVYLNRERSFYLAFRGESGDIEYKDNKPCCFVASNEKWKDYKSSKNLAKCLLIIWDEFLDTDRFTCSIVNELFNNIASFTHMNPNGAQNPMQTNIKGCVKHQPGECPKLGGMLSGAQYMDGFVIGISTHTTQLKWNVCPFRCNL